MWPPIDFKHLRFTYFLFLNINTFQRNIIEFRYSIHSPIPAVLYSSLSRSIVCLMTSSRLANRRLPLSLCLALIILASWSKRWRYLKHKLYQINNVFILLLHKENRFIFLCIPKITSIFYFFLLLMIADLKKPFQHKNGIN